jgi:hypothetical protein
VGELITMAVPMGVEVKVVDSEGDPYLLGFTTIGGGVNLTINKSGDYTLVIGELSSKYWGVNKSITVTDKPTPVVKINPERGVIGRSASIEVLYGSSPLPDASVTIIKPDKSIDSFTTPQSGIVAFTPMVLGEYNIMVEKPRYDSKSVMLMVKNDLSMELNPKAPSAGGNTTITLKNQLGQVVAGAAVSLNGNELGTTNSEGKFTLTIPEPGNYTIKATRKDIMYWDAEVSLVAAAELKVEFSRPNLRAGESTTVEVKDQAGTKLDATIAVKDPAGNAVEVKEGKITPLVPGTHTVTASKEGYGTTVKELVVRPREIEVAWSVKGRNLIIAVSSGGTPLESITVTLKKPVNGTLLTTEDGTVSIPLKKTAEYEIEVNTINQNPGYDTKTEKKLVERDYRLGTLLALIAIILVAAAAVIIIIHKMSGGGGQQTITGSKPPRKTRLQQV